MVAVLVVASQLESKSGGETASGAIVGASANAALFAGIPQHGNVLGAPTAPVTLVEYADLQCPYCAAFARDVLPLLVREYVRSGQVKLVFRGIAFIGADSETALRSVLAAGHEDRLWNLAHLIYANQGVENTGWVTNGFLRSVARAVPPLDPDRLLARARAPMVRRQVAAVEQQAAADGVRATPTFLIGPSGGKLAPLEIASLDIAAFRPALQSLLHG